MLSPTQQTALDTLFAHVPASSPPATPPDFLQTWFGLSREQLTTTWQSWLTHKDTWETHFRATVDKNPLDTAVSFLAAASAAYYAAEKGQNPKISTYTDAFYYIATCASVGYADIFPITQTGKAIAALVMIIGPALAAKSLDHPFP